MKIYLMIKNTFRNKRFVLFTILTPIFWYISLLMFSKSAGFYQERYSYIWFSASCLIGISGNSIVSFSKSINSMKKFYELQIETSPYTILRWLYDEIIVQLILNTIICLGVLLVAIFVGHIRITLNFFFLIIILNIFGIYLSLYGFTLGQFITAKVMDAASFLIMLMISFLIIPFNTWLKSDWIKLISNIQKIFPGYYVNKLSQHLFMGGNLIQPLFYFTLSLILTSVPVLFIILYKLKLRN